MIEVRQTIKEACPLCGAGYAAVTSINAEVDIETMRQLATPRTVYQCGTVTHPANFAEYDVPEQAYQSPSCRAAELARKLSDN